ncbi:MAG: lysylphosphatidylglycerol synthase transmembrane domain-containing protein [Actinomycetota bacterium]
MGASCRSRTLTAISLALLVALVLSRRQDLAAASTALTNAAPLPCLIAIGTAMAGVINRAGQYRSAHRVAGVDTGIREMLRISAAGYALNKVIKTGGVGGVALFVRHGRRRGHPTGSVLAACVVNSLGSQVGMLVMTAFALGTLTLRGSTPGAWTVVAGGALLVLLAGLLTVVLLVLRSQALADRWYPVPFTLARRAGAKFGLDGPADPDPAHVQRFFEMVSTVRDDPAAFVPVLVHSVLAKLIGAATLAAALVAVGAEIGPGAVLVVYVLALAAAATTVLPGGLGAVEATMTLALTSYGVPTTTALAATIIFRLLDLWVPVLLGLLAAPGLDRSAIRANERQQRTPVLEPAGSVA